jgi:5-methyltetrahydropteroyltriglutamate--homocysteine methyltransferase
MTLVESEVDLTHVRVDAVGSLLRPPQLVAAFAAADDGSITAHELRRAQDEAVGNVIAQQESHGLPVMTDGEFRRRHFMQSFAEIAGYAHGATAPVGTAVVTEEKPGVGGAPSMARGHRVRSAVVEPIRLLRNGPLDEFRFAQDLTERVVKASLITPARVVEAYDAAGSRDVYPNADHYLADVIRIQREMISGLVDAGCRYIHIDAPDYAAYVDLPSLAAMREHGEDPEAKLDHAIATDNAIIDGFDGVVFGLHVCRGNFRGRWAREGAYDAIAERLYNDLSYRRILLEYDSERAGSFDSLRFMPQGKIAVLGLISTKSRRVETVDELQRRIEDAARFLPVEQLAISPQCGFASILDGNPLDEDLQWRKLDVMMETAARVWS